MYSRISCSIDFAFPIFHRKKALQQESSPETIVYPWTQS
jgi:hypothetical protein